MSILRSILAAILGYLVFVAGHMLFVQVLGRFPYSVDNSVTAALADAVYYVGVGVLSGYVAAVMGRTHPIAHSSSVPIIAVSIAIAVLFAAKPAGGEAPSSVMTIILGVPFALLGGWLRARQLAARAA